jgi:arylsulfatase
MDADRRHRGPEGGAQGVIATQGGSVGGYGVYVRDGKPTFVYNYLSLERSTFTGSQALPAGKVQLRVDVAYQGGGQGARQGGARHADGQRQEALPKAKWPGRFPT